MLGQPTTSLFHVWQFTAYTELLARCPLQHLGECIQDMYYKRDLDLSAIFCHS